MRGNGIENNGSLFKQTEKWRNDGADAADKCIARSERPECELCENIFTFRA